MYIQVILPLKLSWVPWYSTDDPSVAPGDRVMVPFSGRTYTGVVLLVTDTPGIAPEKILPVAGRCDALAPVTRNELRFWQFVSDYYLCSVGEVYRSAYPEGKTSGERILVQRAEAERRRAERKRASAEAARNRLVGRLAKKDADLARPHGDTVRRRLEEEREKIASELASIDAADELLEELGGDGPADTAATSGESVLQERPEVETLSCALRGGKPVLFTYPDRRAAIEVLACAAAPVHRGGKDVLVLLPENARIEEVSRVLGSVLGGQTVAYHSGLSEEERRQAVAAVREGNVAVIGNRSSLFLPFTGLGLVIVLDEQDVSYKQESTPRLNARDMAVVLGKIHGADVILASSDPSLESVHNVRSGRYVPVDLGLTGWVDEVIDTVAEARKRGMAGSIPVRLVTRTRHVTGCGKKVVFVLPCGDTASFEEEAARLFGDDFAIGNVRVMTLSEALAVIPGCSYGLVAVFGACGLSRSDDFRGDERVAQRLSALGSTFGCPVVMVVKGTDMAAYGADVTRAERVESLLEERRAFRYPPFVRFVDVVVRDANAGRLRVLSGMLREALREFSPEGPVGVRGKPDDRQSAEYYRIRVPRNGEGMAAKRALRDAVAGFETRKHYMGHIVLDVDPA